MEEAIIAILLADAGVAGQIGTQVYPGRAPQGVSTEYALVRSVTRLPDYTMAGPSGYEERRIQIDVYALTYTKAKRTARAIVNALSGRRGKQGAINIQGIFLDGERDLPTTDEDDDVYNRFRTSLDFIIHHA
ncbi:DUF3168 domain-containing protein [Chelativorans sp. J32]|jgi:Protein of unknown function (DUF3168).|uniref:DUF3168 domain-containing protein n=1 Tax=Chelativorans sp. J32 TaxID=935840 RepID=UPI000485A0FC|nr:DUF3168 domain-containing protein [Chelativorans sp. J32]